MSEPERFAIYVNKSMAEDTELLKAYFISEMGLSGGIPVSPLELTVKELENVTVGGVVGCIVSGYGYRMVTE